MFPLSTPTTSGLWVDFLALAIVLAPVCAFALGLADLWRRARLRYGGRASDIDAVTLAAYGALALVGLAVVVMIAGGRGIPVAQAAFLALAAWGLACAAGRAAHVSRWWKAASGDDLVRAAAFAGAACLSIWFWTDVFRDHVALPVAHDGIVHTAYYLRILEAGVPTLGRVPIGFANIFGTQMFQFYPTGTHALMGIASGFWGQWGVVSHAGILKAWFTLAVAAAPWALCWFARRLMPQMPWWIGLGLIVFAMPGFRFPIEAAHEGGASRLLAHVLMTPIYADVLLGRFARWRWRPLSGVVLGLAFLMHPTAFVTLAALLGYASLRAAFSEAWQRRFLGLGVLIVVLAISGALVAELLRWNGAAAFARDPALTFSWGALVSRLKGGWTTLFDSDYGMAPVKQWLIVAGFVLLVLRRRALRLSWYEVGFPVLMLLLAMVAVTAQVIPLPGFRQIGGAFYDDPARVSEALYEAVGVCLVTLAWCVWDIAAGRGGSSSSPGLRARSASLVALVLVGAAIVSQQASIPWVQNNVRHFDKLYSTPRISRLQALGTWIEKNTELDAILFHLPFDSEIWEAWTGRRGIFMYGECQPHGTIPHGPQQACESRKELVTGRIEVLRDLIREPAPAVRCLADIDRFARPGYFLLSLPFASTQAFPACSDATYVMTLDGHAVITYRKP